MAATVYRLIIQTIFWEACLPACYPTTYGVLPTTDYLLSTTCQEVLNGGHSLVGRGVQDQ